MLLFELDNPWNKMSLDWVLANESKVKSWIIHIFNNQEKRSGYSPTDVDTIFSDVTTYFSKARDYSEEYNTKLSTYIWGGVENCIKRFLTQKSKDYNNTVTTKDSEELMNESSEQAYRDTYKDCPAEIERICKALETKRYMYGIDVYLMTYIITSLDGKEMPRQFKMLEASSLEASIDRLRNDETVKDLIGALAYNPGGRRILKKYVYGIKQVDALLVKSIDLQAYE